MTSPLACSAEEAQAPTQEPAAIFSVQDETFEALRTADVVYLGERHDSAADHAAQLTIIEGLYAENPDMAIALEMFQRPFQPAIDRYLAGEISEEELVAQTEYLERWGFPWEFYAPFLRFAQENELPVLALNAPRRNHPPNRPRRLRQSGGRRLSLHSAAGGNRHQQPRLPRLCRRSVWRSRCPRQPRSRQFLRRPGDVGRNHGDDDR